MKLNELIEGGFKECKNIERNISISEDAYNMLLSAHNDLSKLTDEQQLKIKKLEKQCYKNAGTFGRLLNALALSWDKSLNGNEAADKMRAVTQEYGYCMSCSYYCDSDCDS